MCLIASLWKCRSLSRGNNWEDHPHFNPRAAVNSLFYRTIALGLARFGRCEKDPFIGKGSHSLSRCFHYTLLSLYAYWKAGAVTVLLGMFGWWASHFLWLDAGCNDALWCIVVLLLTLISTTFYANTFALQNYNALGWIWMPVGLFGWITENWVLSALAWLAASLGSSTVVVLAGLLSVVYAIETMSVASIITVVPSHLKLSLHLLPNIDKRDIRKALLDIAKAVGFFKGNIKYVRKKTMGFGARRIFLITDYTQFGIIFYTVTGNLPELALGSFAVWLINCRFKRFADDQSMEMLAVTASLAELMSVQGANIWLVLSYWLLVSPPPLFSGMPSLERPYTVPISRPINIRPVLAECEKFLKPVRQNERILMAFDDPQGEYERVFDGYRFLLEVPHFVASKKQIHFLPDWLAVFDLNYQGAPDFWGRSVEDVKRQMKSWKADYVIVYQKYSTKLEEKWEHAGFIPLSHFSKRVFEEFFGTTRPFPEALPDWWLLERRSRADS